MREITSHHVVSPLNQRIAVLAGDNVDSKGTSLSYIVTSECPHDPIRSQKVVLRFQDGPLDHREGVKGITDEALLAVVLDRVQRPGSPYVHSFSEHRLIRQLELALLWCQERESERMNPEPKPELNVPI